jgi:hypothetical protein
MSTITSANSQFILRIPSVFPAPVPLQGYATDDAFAVEPFDIGEAQMGVDGIMSAGFVPAVKRMTVTFQADSPSLIVMDGWVGAEEAAREKFFASAVILLPSVGKEYRFTKGALIQAKKLPDARRVLQPVSYVIAWQDIAPVQV